MKILKSKRGVNDISILTGIITVFVFLGVLLPFLNEDLNVTASEADVDGLESDVGQETGSVSTISAYTVLTSVLTMFFWTFGALPFFIDMILVVFRVIFVLTIARNIWVGGGG